MIQRSFQIFTSWTFVVCVFVCLSISANAQDYKKKYESAKALFDAGSYSAAMVAFRPLSVYDKNNHYSEYASYYYAMSAYRLGYATVAKDQFIQLKKLYPQWEQIDEVNYLICKIYFEQGEYFQAMYIASLIKTPGFESDLTNLKRLNLAKIDDIETLRMMWEEHPSDAEVARVLVKRMSLLPSAEQDKALIDSLITLFNFSREEVIAVESKKPLLKESYNLGLIMPFLANTLDPSPVKKRNQLVLDLYQGMQFAADSLTKTGIKLQLLAYDNERNINTTRNLLNEEELKQLDLLIGPIFQEEAKPVQEFAKTNKVNLLVSPLSSNSELASFNPNSFLFQPSHERIGLHAAELAFNKSTKKSCMVYYGESAKDSVLAFNFIARAKELNMQVTLVQRVSIESTGSILSRLATATEFDEWKNPLQFSLKKDSIGCIFVASSNELVYSKVINSVEARKDSTLVIGLESWLNESSVDYSKYERIRVALASPNFTSLSSPAVLDFRKRYISRYGVLPTDYSAIGYEFVMVIGKILSRYGANFLDTMAQGDFVEGVLMQGFKMSAQRDNELVPFVMLKKGQLKVVDYETK
jgi:ABC-type branched-subunit amino acid transport system substrate-binding protein